MLDIEAILKALSENEVDFVLVGGIAAVAHGSAYVTQDCDLCYARHDANLERLTRALAPFHPRLRGAPEGLPFQLDGPTLRAGLNFTLTTDVGDIDLWGELAGFSSYEEVVENSETLELYGVDCRIMTLEGLIRAKRAVGRGKDLLLLHELEALLALRQESES
ncbi:MAG: nucleotidyltransferase [Anaerolineae bacterium]